MRRILFAGIIVISTSLSAADSKPGLIGEYFYFRWLTSDFPRVKSDVKPTLKRVDKSIDFPWITNDKEFYGTKLIERFYVRWSGALTVPAAGSYTFFTESDDGSRLFVDGNLVVNNHGLHAMQEEQGELDLAAGLHQFKVEYIQYDGGAGIKTPGKKPGAQKKRFPNRR